MFKREERKLISRFLVLASFVFSFALFSTGAAQRFFIVSTSRDQQNSTNFTEDDRPTPIDGGVMTDKQRKHSRIFKGFSEVTGGKKLRDLLDGRSEIYVEMPIGDVLAPRGSDLQRYFDAYLTKVTCMARAIVIGTVASKSSQLTEDGTFTFTDYEIRVDEIVKDNSSAEIRSGSFVTVTRPGGSVSLSGRIIQAKDYNNEPLQVGRRYLLFLRSILDTGAYQALDDSRLEDSFELDGAQITQVSQKALPFANRQKSDAGLFLTRLRSAITNVCN